MAARRTVAMLAVLFVAHTHVPSVFADGFRNPFQSASGIAQGNAFSAQADDPSAIHYNPAGMTQLRGIQQSLGVQLVSPHTRFTSPSGATAESTINGLVGFPPPGQVFITANLPDLGLRAPGDLTVGIGVESLYGFAIKYPDNGPFASAVTSATLPLLDLKPTLAYKVTDRLSVGLGADIFTFASFLGAGHAERKFQSPGGFGLPAGQVETNGTGTTARLNASMLYTALMDDHGKPRINLAFVWRSQAVLPLKGQLLANGAVLADASTSIRIPETYTIGVAGWPVRDAAREWKIEVDVDYVRWQSIRNFDLALSNGVTIQNPQHWSNAVSVGIGTQYTWLQLPYHPAWEMALRAGYLRSTTAIPDANFDPAITDLKANTLSVGLGFLCKPGGRFLGWIDCGGSGQGLLSKKAIAIDLAYNVLLFEPRTVRGNLNPTVDGTYRMITHGGAINLRLNF